MVDSSNPSNPAAKAIPSWQRAQPRPDPAPAAEESAKPETTPSTMETISTQAGAEESAGAHQSKDALLDTASKFLQDPVIRDAPRERKVAFLESKGVDKDHIQKVLGNESNNDTASSTMTPPVSARLDVCASQWLPEGLS